MEVDIAILINVSPTHTEDGRCMFIISTGYRIRTCIFSFGD